MPSANPFRAFVSYCHADAAFAARLQRQLEAYRLPKRLADRAAPFPGHAPGRIGPVFRDRADLSAAQDLSAAVREAIALSSALIVVASPDAEHSIWVKREIDLFHELHPGAPILVALIRGEPEESLPQSLREGDIEPLAADFRREGDGKRLAFLKLVAALLDLPLDAVVQRDAQRQLRRVTAVTLGAVTMVVIMAMLLVMAVRAREQAERQRAAAEGLVEYMLTDLREGLRGFGRPAVMAAVNERAMAYYASQGDLSKLPDDSIERRARVLHAMGENDVGTGDLDRAGARFAEARRATAAILARKPRNANAIFAHAQSEFWIGIIASIKNDRAALTRHWRAYRDLARALGEVEPGSIRALMEQGFAEGNLCDLNYREHFNVPAATRHCRDAIRYESAALAKAPGDLKIRRDLANRYGWMARVELEQRNFQGALISRTAERALMNGLLKIDPTNSDYIMRRTWIDIAIGQIQIDSGNPSRAVPLLQRIWREFEPRLALGKDYDVWSTGLRIRLFLARAKRLAKARDQREYRLQAEALGKRTIEEFPDMADRTRQLVSNVI